MAITTNPIVVEKIPFEGNEWSVSMYSADLRDCEILKAAEANKYHYVTKVVINTITTMAITIGSGATANAVTTIYLGPINFTAAQPTIVLNFVDEERGNKGFKVAKGTDLTVDSTAAGAVWIYVEGKTSLR